MDELTEIHGTTYFLINPDKDFSLPMTNYKIQDFKDLENLSKEKIWMVKML